MRRFYTEVAVIETAGRFAVDLDERPARTPAGSRLVLPTGALARAVAEEWRAQKDEIEPDTMPLTRLAATAIDRVASDREAVVDQVASYGGSELVCYRADRPPNLVLRQHEVWQPLVDWAAQDLDAHLVVTTGVVPIAQPPEALSALSAVVAALDDFELTAIHSVTTAAGSLVIALALAAGRLDPGAAFAASHLDELFQAEEWGEDAEAAQRRDTLRAEIEIAARFLALARPG
ncbi:MAG: ATP12 family chaperone protein [Alphaproteobacteria bacterium]